MFKLEYLLGEIDVDPRKIFFSGNNPGDAAHKFVVEGKSRSALIYVAPGKYHDCILERFNLDYKSVVGGGSLYINPNNSLVLDDYSGNYGAIPKSVALDFCKLLLPEFDRIGLNVESVFSNTDEIYSFSYWHEKGF